MKPTFGPSSEGEGRNSTRLVLLQLAFAAVVAASAVITFLGVPGVALALCPVAIGIGVLTGQEIEKHSRATASQLRTWEKIRAAPIMAGAVVLGLLALAAWFAI